MASRDTPCEGNCSGSAKRFTSLKPGFWQLQDTDLGYAEQVILYEESRGNYLSPEYKYLLKLLHGEEGVDEDDIEVMPAEIEAEAVCCYDMEVVSDSTIDWNICLNCGHVSWPSW